MADTNENMILDGVNKTTDIIKILPVVAEFIDTGGNSTPGKQVQTAVPEIDQGKIVPTFNTNASPTPGTADTEKKQDVTHHKATQELSTDESPQREQETPLKPLASKPDDFIKQKPSPEEESIPAQTKTVEKSPQVVKSENAASEKPKVEKPPKSPKDKKTASVGGGGISGIASSSNQTSTKDTPPIPVAPAVPSPPRDATRPGKKETIIYIDHSELFPFKNHPFQVRDDDSMKSLVDSIKERGLDQAAIVRPRESGGYEIIAGHRRQHASELAGMKNIPCVVRNMTDEEAILAMTESNFTFRTEILASERAQALKMQLDAIKRQGERFKGVATGDVGKRSNEIVAERNKMGVKTVQRYIALNNLVPELMQMMDDKKIPFMTGFEMSYIKPKNQQYIAMTIEAQESAPTLAQAQRMKELDSKGVLNGDVIDGIILEEKKEDIKVIISGQELSKYFGVEKSPKEMKDTILKLLDEYKVKNPLELEKPVKTKEQEK